jgi:hypothetical protein
MQAGGLFDEYRVIYECDVQQRHQCSSQLLLVYLQLSGCPESKNLAAARIE